MRTTQFVKEAVANVVGKLVKIINREIAKDQPAPVAQYEDDYNDGSHNWKPHIHPDDMGTDLDRATAAHKRYNAELENSADKITVDDAPRPGMPVYHNHATGALAYQVGGNNYKDMPIQPVEYSHRNGIGWIEGNVIKYISRHNKNGGKGQQDIQKAAHYCRLLLQMTYGHEQDGMVPWEQYETAINRLKAEHLKFKADFKGKLLDLKETVMGGSAAPTDSRSDDLGNMPDHGQTPETLEVYGRTYLLDPLQAAEIAKRGPGPKCDRNRQEAREAVLNWYGKAPLTLIKRLAETFDLDVRFMGSPDDPLCIKCGRPKSMHRDDETFEPTPAEWGQRRFYLMDLAERWVGDSSDSIAFVSSVMEALEVDPREFWQKFVKETGYDSDLDDENTDLTDSEIDDHVAETEAAVAAMDEIQQAGNLGLVTITKCIRCGKRHEGLALWTLANAPAPYDRWVECPVTCMPILLAEVAESTPGKAASPPSIQQY